MFKYIIYLITIIIIVYFQFVGTDMQKNSDLKIVQEYLTIPVPIDTINTDKRTYNSYRCWVWQHDWLYSYYVFCIKRNIRN